MHTLGCNKSIVLLGRGKMQDEPSIVKILREEERLGKLHSSDHYENGQNTQDSSNGLSYDFLSTSTKIHESSFLITNTELVNAISEAIFKMSEIAILVIDVDGKIISWNTFSTELLRETDETIFQKAISSFFSSDEWSRFLTSLDRQPTRHHHFETRITLKNNTVLDVEVTLSVLRNKKGTYLGFLCILKDIAEKKKTEEQLAEKEKKYRIMFEFFPQTIALVDKQGVLLDINERIYTWLGYQPEEIIGKDFFSLPFFTKESELTIKKNFSKRMESNKVEPYEIEVQMKTGEERVGMVYATLLKDEHGEVTTHLIVITDVTERKQMEELLRVKDSAITSSINAIALANLDGILTYVNKSFLKMWGYSTEKQVIGKSLAQFWKLKGKYVEIMDAVIKKGEWIGELSGIRRDHSTLKVQLSANMIKDHSGKPICMMGSFVDITQYKKTLKALSESEKKFRVVLENSLDMIYQFNVKKKIYDYVSPSSRNVLGYIPEEVTSFPLQQIEELIYPEDRNRWRHHFKTITNYEKKRDVNTTIEYRIKHKTLDFRWVSDTSSVIFDEKHEPVSVVGTIEDITDRKKVWDELVKSEEKYRVLAETSADGVFTTDALGRLTYVNPSFVKLCKRRKSQILATPFRNYLLEDSIYFFQQIFIDVHKKNEKIENVELDLVDGEGGITPIEVNMAPLQKESDFSGVVCTIRDITQRREIEDELKKNERLKTEFMNIAAHELRSPVTPIKGYLDLIIHDTDSSEKIKNWAKISLRNAERLLKLVNDILDVARLDSDTMRFEMEKLNPVDLLNEIAEDMRPAITNKKLEFRLDIPSDLPCIVGDKIRLSQVLKNLIGNALKFTDYGFIGIGAEKKENQLVITVSDSGIGISKDEIKKIFTKFYQAYTGEDRNNEGTGLGLFISKEIMKKHNGTIWAESDIGKGSRFMIRLPYIHKMTVDFNREEE
jgi:PAS domain S-box-containing protein